MRRYSKGAVILALCGAAFGSHAVAQTTAASQAVVNTFNQTFAEVRSRPDFTHSVFGVEIYSLDRKIALYKWNAEMLFAAGSTTKLLTEGTALQLLGPDYRFHTTIYRTGEIEKGTLHGNLVLVASGDPDLSGRIQPDGTLGFTDIDHSYGGFESKVVGDPLAALDNLAKQIAGAGIRNVDGQVLIDATLFAEESRQEGAKYEGTGVVTSPVIVNDNLIDIVISPASVAGQPATIRISPQPAYITFTNDITTGAAGSKFAISAGEPESAFAMSQSQSLLADGRVQVTLRGSIPVGRGAYVSNYPVASPSRFARALLTEALERNGVAVAGKNLPASGAGDQFKESYTPRNRVADYVSAPLSEDIKVTLKVSQNLHANSMPYVLGAVLGKAKTSAAAKGFELERNFLTKAGLDLSGAAQSDGAGGKAYFTPDFMVHYLAYMAAQKNYPLFRNALPILGRDGTLRDVEVASPAAGHVVGKTGTVGWFDILNGTLLLTGKGLVGYTTTATGEHVAFAIYANLVPIQIDIKDPIGALYTVEDKVGNPLGEIAAAANLFPIEPEKFPANDKPCPTSGASCQAP